MQNIKNKALTIGLSIATAVALPATIFAQVSTTTADTAVGTVITDVSASMGGNIVKILAIVAGLLALGWGFRKFRHYVSGRKF